MTSSDTIAFQGLPGAYSDLACRDAYPGWTTLPCPSFEAAMDAVRRAGVGFSRAARWGRGAGDNAVGPVEAAQVKTWSVALEAWHGRVGATGCLP